jgi:ketosteroid isomerase-like protein
MKLEEMEKRLRTMEEIEAIKNLQNEYLFYVLNRQWTEIPDFFTDDAFIIVGKHGTCHGKKEITKFFMEVVSKANAGKDRDTHFAVMPVITVDGDRASGHWMLYIFIADPATGAVSRFNQGRYDCEYLKRDGKWKFSKLIWTDPWPLTPESMPRPEDWQ